MKLIPSLIALSVSTSCLAAKGPQQWQEQPGSKQWQPGFSGEIAVMAGFLTKTSRFNTRDKSTNNINGSGNTKTQFLGGPLGTIKYTFDSADKQVFLGNNRSDIALGQFNFEIGYRQSLGQNGVISASVLPGLIPKKTWADPFLMGQDRKETNSKVQALRLKYDQILGTGLSLDLAGGKLKVDDENSGDSIGSLAADEKKLLKRDSKIIYGKISHRYMLAPKLFLRGGISYLKHNADGDAMSLNEYGAEVGLARISKDYTLALNFLYRNSQYKESNPVFDKKQKDNRYRLNLVYSYDEPFGLTGWDFVSIAGYTYNNSNIDFYDEKSLIVMGGLSYKF